MNDFDNMVMTALRYRLSIKIECEIDGDGDYRVRAKLILDGDVISESEDYFDGTGAKP